MADFGDQQQFDLENQVVALVWDCLGQGTLAQVQGLAPRPTVVNTAQADGQKMLKNLGLAASLAPLLPRRRDGGDGRAAAADGQPAR